MGNPDFNGKKFDWWENAPYNEYGVWNNEMWAKQYIDEWNGIYAPSKEAAISKAKELNDKIIDDSDMCDDCAGVGYCAGDDDIECVMCGGSGKTKVS